jgi:hypothetical protein
MLGGVQCGGRCFATSSRFVAAWATARGVVETNATRLPSIREVDKRKPAFGHARSQSDWSGEYSPGGRILRVPALGQRRTFQTAIAMSALPPKRTCGDVNGMSAKGQYETFAEVN